MSRLGHLAIWLLGAVVAAVTRLGTLGTAILAGIAFGICDLLVVFALEQIFPERETVVQRLVVALVLGAASILISRGQRS